MLRITAPFFPANFFRHKAEALLGREEGHKKGLVLKKGDVSPNVFYQAVDLIVSVIEGLESTGILVRDLRTQEKELRWSQGSALSEFMILRLQGKSIRKLTSALSILSSAVLVTKTTSNPRVWGLGCQKELRMNYFYRFYFGFGS